MNDLWGQVKGLVRAGWSQRRTRGEARRQREALVHQAIERLVERTDPRLRALPGYRRKLFAAVDGCLVYCTELAGRIPGPLTLDRPNWGTDPVLNALFGDWERVRQVLSGPAVRAYVKATALETADCYAVLAALPMEIDRLGMELVGDDVQRDVRQKVLTFANHEVGLPGPDESSVRAQAVQAVMDNLVVVAAAEIGGQEERIADLEERLRMVRIKRKSMSPGLGGGLDFLHDDTAGHLAESQALERRAVELEQELAGARTGLATLDDYLVRLNAILTEPQRHLGARPERYRLDRMNLGREGADAGGESRVVELLRGYRSDRPGRVLVLIRFRREDLIPDRERLAEIERYAGT